MAKLEDAPTSDVWFLDSGCSNHMTGTQSLFKDLDETYKIKGRLGDDKQVQVEDTSHILKDKKTNQVVVEKKSEAFEAFKKFKVLVEKRSGKHVKTLRANQGEEFMCEEFNSFCEENGIN
ncbi:hypothetical protein ACH5RR_034651 [Cinchona calisaya]|uniref:Retrovirus-related Pol polyprotein from transposon TNT 1-94-like beta-barrel domain-containing protein n=1 Tax=Cinchona calisaya TaxID=153742 RepID=A0ABD2YF41_9GENT